MRAQSSAFGTGERERRRSRSHVVSVEGKTAGCPQSAALQLYIQYIYRYTFLTVRIV